MPVKSSLVKALANAVSMITVPTGALAITSAPMNYWAWVLLLIGIGVQIAKYYKEEEEE